MIYPHIMESLELIKSRKMRCFVTTNITPITEKRASRMVELGVDRLYASIWAATPETYSITHSKSGEEDFHKIDKTLRHILQLKGGNRLTSPQIIIHNVIFNQPLLKNLWVADRLSST